MKLRLLAIGAAYGVFLFFFALVASLLGIAEPAQMAAVLGSSRVFFSIKLSIAAAIVATVFSILLAIPSAYALSRYEFFGKKMIDTVLEIPLLVTPVALGAMLLVFFNTRAGALVQSTGLSFVFGFSGIVLAQFVTTVGIATRMIKGTFDDISPRYELVACTLGATPWRAFRTVTLPMARNGILAGTIITFAKCIGEFGATIMLAGSMPFKTETLPISIFLRLGNADIVGMAVLILILLAIGTTVLLTVRLGLTATHD